MESKLPEEIQKKVDKLAQTYESATPHEGLGPAIFKDGVYYALAYAKIVAEKEHQQLKDKAEKMVLELRRCLSLLVVHPDYQPNSEFRDRAESINEAIAWKEGN